MYSFSFSPPIKDTFLMCRWPIIILYFCFLAVPCRSSAMVWWQCGWIHRKGHLNEIPAMVGLPHQQKEELYWCVL
ncbi:hypothetical protein BDF14DRAFT_1800647 [Spinellus fusiger]|nr:hypothetical protein BDF14DRAFT_1800647 [Spinellus fusiger]